MEKYYKAYKHINEYGGIIRTGQAIKAGIAPKTLYDMLADGIITRIARGVYTLAGHRLTSNPDLITVAVKYPSSVVCLISALNYYNLTEQIAYFVYIALPRGVRKPQLSYPPLKIIWLSEKIYDAGIQEVTIDNTPIKIYSPEKTITDCFKFRNKYGLDVAIDALKRYLALPASKQDFDSLMYFARLNRVEKIMLPHIQALA